MSQFWDSLLDEDNRGRLQFVVGIIVLMVGAAWAILKFSHTQPPTQEQLYARQVEVAHLQLRVTQLEEQLSQLRADEPLPAEWAKRLTELEQSANEVQETVSRLPRSPTVLKLETRLQLALQSLEQLRFDLSQQGGRDSNSTLQVLPAIDETPSESQYVETVGGSGELVSCVSARPQYSLNTVSWTTGEKPISLPGSNVVVSDIKVHLGDNDKGVIFFAWRNDFEDTPRGAIAMYAKLPGYDDYYPIPGFSFFVPTFASTEGETITSSVTSLGKIVKPSEFDMTLKIAPEGNTDSSGQDVTRAKVAYRACVIVFPDPSSK